MSQSPAESPFSGKKKRRVWAWLFLWFLMPFTAFLELEKLFTDDEDPKDLDDDPHLGERVTESQELASTPNKEPLDKG